MSYFTVRLLILCFVSDIFSPPNEPNLLFLVLYYVHLSPKGELASDTYCSHIIRKLSMVEGGEVIEVLNKG